MASAQQVPLGSLNPWSGAGALNTLVQLIQNQLSKVQTVTLCQVQSCTNDGGVSPFGFVDVLPLVSQVDGAGNAVPHLTLHEVPYLRIQGGSSAIIIDPQPGDIGILLTCSRDITSVVATQGENTPGSPRQFSFADSLYIGGLLNVAPAQYLQFNDDGVTLVTPQKLTLQSTDDTDITASGDVTVTAPSISLGASGSTPVPVCSQPLVTWINSTLLPALAAHSITVSAPPSNSLTSTLEAS